MSEMRYQTLREYITSVIRSRIYKHELKPGSRIKEQDITEEFGISHGPVREALRQLEQEGLVEYSRNVGCSVKVVSLNELYEIYLHRTLFEIIAVKICNGVLPEKKIEELGDILNTMKDTAVDDYDNIFQYEIQFHQCIIELAGLTGITKFWDELKYGTAIELYWEKELSITPLTSSYEVHKALYDTFATHDTSLICEAICKLYMDVVDRFCQETNQELGTQYQIYLDCIKKMI